MKRIIQDIIRNLASSRMVRCVIACCIVAGLNINNTQAANNSNEYQTALGIKVWNGAGVSVKHFIHNGGAIEGIGYFWDRGFRLTGLYEFHFPIPQVAGLQWYVGPGAHLGIYNTGKIGENGFGSGVYAGVDGVIGVDYCFQNIPLNLSADWQPSFEFGSGRGFYGGWGGIGIRYVF